MERWAANTLRILGIIVTSIVVICGGLLLVLLGQCASHGGFEGGRNADGGAGYFLGVAILGIGGITFIATLARGIHRSRQAPPIPATPHESAAAGQLTSEAHRAIDLLTWSLIAQLAVCGLSLAYTVIQYQSIPIMRVRQATILAVISSALSALPYALLLFFLNRRISRAVLAFALGLPAASVLLILITTPTVIHFYMRSPLTLATLIIPLAIDIVIIVLAYQAQQPTGIMLPASSLVTTTVASLVYFYFLRLTTQLLFRTFVR